REHGAEIPLPTAFDSERRDEGRLHRDGSVEVKQERRLSPDAAVEGEDRSVRWQRPGGEREAGAEPSAGDERGAAKGRRRLRGGRLQGRAVAGWQSQGRKPALAIQRDFESAQRRGM